MFGVAKIVQGESKEKEKPQDFHFLCRAAAYLIQSSASCFKVHTAGFKILSNIKGVPRSVDAWHALLSAVGAGIADFRLLP